MSKHFQVEANGTIFGVYVADDEQAARDACAVDAGYRDEADMVDQLNQPSDLVAHAAMASADVQALYRLTIEASTVEIDD